MKQYKITGASLFANGKLVGHLSTDIDCEPEEMDIIRRELKGEMVESYAKDFSIDLQYRENEQ